MPRIAGAILACIHAVVGFGFLRRSTAYFPVGVRFFVPFCLALASSLTLFNKV